MERAVQDALVAPGLGLPFLNEDNKQLLRDLQQLQLEVAEKGGALDTAQKLVQHKQEQLAHMTQALQQLQDLRSSQAKTTTAEEEHEKALRREIESTQRHNDGHQKQLHDQHQVQAFLESCIVQVSKELDHIYSTLELDAQLVDDLLDEIAAKESDNLLLLQYAREDASKVKSLSVALETICTAITSTENSLEQARGDVSVARTEQEQLVQAFVQTAAERDQLLQQWEMSLVQLQQKDDDMRRLLEDLILVAQQQGDMRKGIEREEVILSHIREACEEEEVLIKTIEAETERTQAQYLDVLNTRDILRGEVAALQNGLAKTRKDAELLKGRIQVLGSTREEKNNLLQQLQKQIQKAEEKLALDTELLLSTDESIHAMETIIKEMENGQTQLEKRVERLRSLLLQRSQELFRWQEAERLSLADLRTLHMTKKKLQAALRTLDEKDIQQKQVLYEQDLQIQHLRRRLHALTHDSNNNEVDPRQQQHVADLRERLHLVTLAKDLLTKQISSLQRLVQHEQSDVDRRQEACERLKEKLSEVQLSNVNAEREGLQLRGEREDLSVDITLLRLRIRGRLAQVAGTTASTNKLTHERSEMQKLVKEQCEGVHRRLVEMEGRRRSLATEIHELTKRTHLTSVRLQQLKDRYEEIKATLQAPQDAEELSPAFIMLKVNEEREGLQETGDLLDAEIRHAEEEVVALQNLVALVNMEGQEYRSHLHNLTRYSEEHVEKVQLEGELAQLEDEVKHLEEQHRLAWLALKSAEEQVHEGTLQLHAVNELLREKALHTTTLRRELSQQETKIRHAALSNASLTRQTRGMSKKQRDIELRLWQERLKTVNSLLGAALAAYPEASPTAIFLCQQQNIPPPDSVAIRRRSLYGSRSSLGTMNSSRSGDSKKGEDDEEGKKKQSGEQDRGRRRGERRRRGSPSPSSSPYFKGGPVSRSPSLYSSLSSLHSLRSEEVLSPPLSASPEPRASGASTSTTSRSVRDPKIMVTKGTVRMPASARSGESARAASSSRALPHLRSPQGPSLVRRRRTSPVGGGRGRGVRSAVTPRRRSPSRDTYPMNIISPVFPAPTSGRRHPQGNQHSRRPTTHM
ncbi:coiled-coil domain-containing protein 39-like isoform X3 [Oratosquilla oratoria]|uniref:coiled-coil domain-containing protein 39-like isoform X3 n=1 Tax=Oratosquilla oratoria TaxID=337810 RepID=UPI003F768433